MSQHLVPVAQPLATHPVHPLIPTRWQVPEEFHRRLGEKAGRQRAMVAQNHLLLILHKLPKPGDPERQPRLFWRDPSGAWQESEGGAAIAELNTHLDEFDRATEQLETILRGAPSAENYFAVLNQTTPLLRAARHLHAALQQAREAIPNDRHLVLARDSAGEIERTLELLHSDALHGMQFLVAARAEEQARASEQLVVSNHRLNVVIALFLPLTALASVLGMNVRHGLENSGPAAFVMVVFVGLLLGAMVVALVNRPIEQKSRQFATSRTPKKKR